MSWEILDGDCLERLADLDDDSIDAVVTDPPYGLSAEPDAAEVLRHWLDGDDYQHRGGGFMGKTWDSFVPGPTVWKECLRVLKPGGHLVAFFGTRTVDLGGMAIRLAGFKIRDCLAWHYGSGFPKSLDVSKAMDKAAGAERKVIGHTDPHDPRTAMARKMYGTDLQDEPGQGIPITEAATAEAAQWEGWGTALKPAFEPIILARKPLIGTVAENVTRYGTGALNVDGCRVAYEKREVDFDRKQRQQNSDGTISGAFGAAALIGTEIDTYKQEGRWPANLILDDQAAAMLDEQSGETSSHSGTEKRDRTFRPGTNGQQGFAESENIADYGDTGGASRFFYQAKASRAERNAGLDGFEEQVDVAAIRPRTRKCRVCGTSAKEPGPSGRYPNCEHGDWEYVENASARHKGGVRNAHPTVKPIDLMRWLVRLVTPPGGTVLDPFTGSGTTGIAAGLEGFKFVGIEREAEYRKIAEARLKWWAEQEGETAEILQRAGLAEKERAKAEAAGQTSLFEGAA